VVAKGQRHVDSRQQEASSDWPVSAVASPFRNIALPGATALTDTAQPAPFSVHWPLERVDNSGYQSHAYACVPFAWIA
jgi:hypothetical protein